MNTGFLVGTFDEFPVVLLLQGWDGWFVFLPLY